MLYKLWLVSLLDKICSYVVQSTSARVRYYAYISCNVKIKLFCCLHAFQNVEFSFVRSNNRATSFYICALLSVSCKVEIFCASSHFNFYIMSIFLGLFVFETVSGLIKPPHKMIQVKKDTCLCLFLNLLLQ